MTFKSPSLGQVASDPKLFTQLLQQVLDQIENALRKADPVGAERVWAGQYGLPEGWVACDGTEYDQVKFPELYATIGQTFGGSTGTFRVPNRTADYPVGHIWMIRVE